MRWIMDALQHARYKQPSCGVSLSGFLSDAGEPMKEKTRSSSSHLEYLPSPVPSPESSRKLNSGKDLAGPSSCPVGSGAARALKAGAGSVSRALGLILGRSCSACALGSTAQQSDKGENLRGFLGFQRSGGCPHSG